MNKSNINEPSAGTEVDNDSTAQNHSVRQPNANTNVVGSLFQSREIKFRAWLIPDDDFESELPYMTYDLAFEDYTPVNEQLKSVSTLMQFTGLKDKIGKEIYEGDIVMLFGMRHTVIFKDGAFGYNTIEQPNNTYDYFIPLGANGHFEWENGQSRNIIVIGNIFENPELLQTLR